MPPGMAAGVRAQLAADQGAPWHDTLVVTRDEVATLNSLNITRAMMLRALTGRDLITSPFPTTNLNLLPPTLPTHPFTHNLRLTHHELYPCPHPAPSSSNRPSPPESCRPSTSTPPEWRYLDPQPLATHTMRNPFTTPTRLSFDLAVEVL
eukprot:3043160-Amphidinium_carterae.1